MCDYFLIVFSRVLIWGRGLRARPWVCGHGAARARRQAARQKERDGTVSRSPSLPFPASAATAPACCAGLAALLGGCSKRSPGVRCRSARSADRDQDRRPPPAASFEIIQSPHGGRSLGGPEIALVMPAVPLLPLCPGAKFLAGGKPTCPHDRTWCGTSHRHTRNVRTESKPAAPTTLPLRLDSRPSFWASRPIPCMCAPPFNMQCRCSPAGPGSTESRAM